MALDVSRAYFYAPASRPIFIQIPAEDRLGSDAGKVAQLNISVYGTRDAAKNWTATYTTFLQEVGFVTGEGCGCNFAHSTRQISLTVHGDDFTASASDADLAWLEEKFKVKFECKVEILGPGRNQLREVRILNRVVGWCKDGLLYEADQRHAEIVVRDLGLESAKPASRLAPVRNKRRRACP